MKNILKPLTCYRMFLPPAQHRTQGPGLEDGVKNILKPLKWVAKPSAPYKPTAQPQVIQHKIHHYTHSEPRYHPFYDLVMFFRFKTYGLGFVVSS